MITKNPKKFPKNFKNQILNSVTGGKRLGWRTAAPWLVERWNGRGASELAERLSGRILKLEGSAWSGESTHRVEFSLKVQTALKWKRIVSRKFCKGLFFSKSPPFSLRVQSKQNPLQDYPHFYYFNQLLKLFLNSQYQFKICIYTEIKYQKDN